MEKAKTPRVILRAPYNYDVDQASQEAATYTPGPSLTDQDGAVSADINEIVKRFGLTGELPLTKRTPLPAGDYEACDYRDALDLVRSADASFSSLPSAVRKQHDNDPAKFLEWVENASPEDLAKLLPSEAGADKAVPTGTASANAAPPAAG